ncbi:MAG TPA: hypothetical protein VFN23_18495 [Ktedonobacteraceae bacterium]|nr:hypothetical protein [Ktedonobacteraceae bacterium]
MTNSNEKNDNQYKSVRKMKAERKKERESFKTMKWHGWTWQFEGPDPEKKKKEDK